jgi:hypothetical protein
MSMPRKTRRKAASSCNVKLARIRSLLLSRTPSVLAIAEIEHLVGIGKTPHWRKYSGSRR